MILFLNLRCNSPCVSLKTGMEYDSNLFPLLSSSATLASQGALTGSGSGELIHIVKYSHYNLSCTCTGRGIGTWDKWFTEQFCCLFNTLQLVLGTADIPV